MDLGDELQKANGFHWIAQVSKIGIQSVTLFFM